MGGRGSVVDPSGSGTFKVKLQIEDSGPGGVSRADTLTVSTPPSVSQNALGTCLDCRGNVLLLLIQMIGEFLC